MGCNKVKGLGWLGASGFGVSGDLGVVVLGLGFGSVVEGLELLVWVKGLWCWVCGLGFGALGVSEVHWGPGVWGLGFGI